MHVEMVLGIAAAVISLVATVPYTRDVLRGRVRPARSSRLMLELLLAVAFYQQLALGGSWALAITAGELVSCGVLLLLSAHYGVGGWQRSDIICYVLLAVDLMVWWQTAHVLYGLYLTIVADLIAFWPTLYKTWHYPDSETSLWYWSGVTAGLLSALAAGALASTVIFPLYLMLINLLEVVLISRRHLHRKNRKREVINTTDNFSAAD